MAILNFLTIEEELNLHIDLEKKNKKKNINLKRKKMWYNFV